MSWSRRPGGFAGASVFQVGEGRRNASAALTAWYPEPAAPPTNGDTHPAPHARFDHQSRPPSRGRFEAETKHYIAGVAGTQEGRNAANTVEPEAVTARRVEHEMTRRLPSEGKAIGLSPRERAEAQSQSSPRSHRAHESGAEEVRCGQGADAKHPNLETLRLLPQHPGCGTNREPAGKQAAPTHGLSPGRGRM